ncbi:Seizure protein 6 [Saguinus oedipus]|uniref:Seizure protein 6 n=1 Tax=Saguinus oedipus TaxID=9490 RepID=A0ABQ9VQR1_SAGOE|nr:Seizure protein 6 [Saguinus oedipus]
MARTPSPSKPELRVNLSPRLCRCLQIASRLHHPSLSDTQPCLAPASLALKQVTNYIPATAADPQEVKKALRPNMSPRALTARWAGAGGESLEQEDCLAWETEDEALRSEKMTSFTRRGRKEGIPPAESHMRMPSLQDPEGGDSGSRKKSDCFALLSPLHWQVQNISLREGETVTVEGLGGPDPLPLANQSFLLRGQVIRSPTHQAALRFQSLPPPAGPGTFHFHYQEKEGARKGVEGPSTHTRAEAVQADVGGHDYEPSQGPHRRTKFQLPSYSLRQGGEADDPDRHPPPPSSAFLALDLAPETDSSEKITQQIAVTEADLPYKWLSSRPHPAHIHSVTCSVFAAYLLSCHFPRRPAYGDVTVTSLHPGGSAHFHCATGYQLKGARLLTCLNATQPFWDSKEPVCIAACGGVIRNATTGRIISPGFPGNYSNNLTCHWLLEAPEGQRLHLHFEKVSLAEDDDRLIIRNGDNVEAPPVYDSYEVEYLPIEGLLSSGRHFFVELSTDSSGAAAGMALRYEVEAELAWALWFTAFQQGHCYEPFVKYGNFSSSAPSYPVGTTVEFSCDPGYTLEQGSIIIECVDPHDPQWNETEPACRAVCSGEITDSAGVVLSPNWPEPYGRGQDCIWGVHVEEDKRIMLDIRVLRIGPGDILTFYDGDDLTARVLGQYSGPRSHFKLFTSMADVTIQFQSDPGTSVLGYQQGFVIHFFEVPRNDTCPELPEIPNGWKSPSQPELVHGTVVTYQCYPGYQVVGSSVLMCQWDLTWSEDLPSCQRVTSCHDPGDVEHSRRLISSPKFPVGATVQYICDQGFVLTGSSILTCHDRQAGSPKWSDRAPKCLCKCQMSRRENL